MRREGEIVPLLKQRFREMFRQAQHDTLSVIPSVAEESRGNEKGSLILIVLLSPCGGVDSPDRGNGS